jgi:hypothetical protein
MSVIDRVPKLAEVSTQKTIGTLEPTKILKHEKKGTLIKWEIDTIESQEERILSYKIITKLSILGRFTMPQTIVKYQTKRGRERVVSSSKSKA